MAKRTQKASQSVARPCSEAGESAPTLAFIKDAAGHYLPLFEENPSFLCVHHAEGRLLAVNKAAASALGHSPHELVGRNIRDFVAGVEAAPAGIDEFGLPGNVEGFITVIARDQSTQVWRYRNTVVCEGNVEYVVTAAQDVTALKASEESALRLSFTDDLTGVFNRRGFLTVAETHLRLLARSNPGAAVLVFYADLNGLKRINDRFGHHHGSAALVGVAHILRRTFRASDIVGRLGGDEFVVLVPDAQPDDHQRIAARLDDHVRDYNRERHHPSSLTLTTGAAVASTKYPVSLEDLMNRADLAMYRRKHRRLRQRMDTPVRDSDASRVRSTRRPK
jgi:diguanylate cyclase (GGDEF)-like protein/PAS domain S-box-containing protein